MVVLSWFVRILSIGGVGFGFATVAFQSGRAAKDENTPAKLVILLITFWCIVAGAALAVLAETFTTITPHWLGSVTVFIECLLWAAILIEFGIHQ